MSMGRAFGRYAHLWQWLFREVDGSSLAVFRMCFGAAILFESINYGLFLCLDCMYRSSEMLFKFHYFEWVALLPGRGLEWVLAVMGLSAIGVILGWYYRFCIVVLVVCFAYLFLLDQALYLNHFYMVLLLGGILIFVPANRCWSIDATGSAPTSTPTCLIPNWSLVWMAIQLEVILIYAGLVKLNSDWLNLEPMRLWMREQSADENMLLQWLTHDPGLAAASYGVVALHLIGAPMLLFKKTRLPVFVVYCIFHSINSMVFNIGIFPWLTIAATLLLFDPDWPRQVLRWLNLRGRLLSLQHHTQAVTSARVSTSGVAKPAIVVFISVWLVLQVTIPVRHLFMPGDVAWNEAGHRFSWRMKLRDKRGSASFRAVAEDGRYWLDRPEQRLTKKQYRKMVCLPDLLWQYAQMIDVKYGKLAGSDVKIYAETSCSLNTRKPAVLIKKQVDLSGIPRNHPVELWVTTLTETLPKPLF